jgi:hypothetical protein
MMMVLHRAPYDMKIFSRPKCMEMTGSFVQQKNNCFKNIFFRRSCYWPSYPIVLCSNLASPDTNAYHCCVKECWWPGSNPNETVRSDVGVCPYLCLVCEKRCRPRPPQEGIIKFDGLSKRHKVNRKQACNEDEDY